MIVLWRVTNKCNFGCAFCAYDRALKLPKTDVLASEVERFARLLGDWSRQSGEKVLFSWLGGEPFLWPHLLGLSRKLHREDYDIATSQVVIVGDFAGLPARFRAARLARKSLSCADYLSTQNFGKFAA